MYTEKNEEISGFKAQIHTWKRSWYISTITEVFLKLKSSEVHNRVVSRGQNELIGEFKMAGSDVISIGGVGYEVHVHSNRN